MFLRIDAEVKSQGVHYPGDSCTGIGFSTMKRIIEAHGGKVWAESGGEGKGTTICFTLPVTGDRT